MLANCGLGWQQKALVEALGTPDEDALQPDSAMPGIRLRVLRWRCGEGGMVSAVKAPHEPGYRLEASCRHRAHHDLLRLPEIRVSDAAVLDADGEPLDHVPADLDGVRLRFRLESPVKAYARVDVNPDMESPGPLTRSIKVDGDTFGPGAVTFDLPLTEADPLDEPLRREVTLSIHVLDPKTAAKDRNTDGVCIWRGDYTVDRSGSRA
jgi:hypothetical protein